MGRITALLSLVLGAGLTVSGVWIVVEALASTVSSKLVLASVPMVAAGVVLTVESVRTLMRAG